MRPAGFRLPPRATGTAVRVLATNDLLSTVVPLPTSYGLGGSIAGVSQLLDGESERGPALWLDSGDLSAGPAWPLLGRKVWDELGSVPLSAAVAGNHEFDEGTDALADAAGRLPWPLLCADREAGLPGSAILDTPAGGVGVVGITHPDSNLLSAAPPLRPDATARITELIRRQRRAGARWVIALVHDGVTWWPQPPGAASPIACRADGLRGAVAGWAPEVDAVLGGHTLGAWTGRLNGTPAGHAHPFAASVLPVDLCAGGRVAVHPPARVPPVTPAAPSPARQAILAAARRPVARTDRAWTSHPHTPHYLPDLVALALRESTGADAGFTAAGELWTQAPLDGVVAALPMGTVSELDLYRLFSFPDDSVAVVDLSPGEYARLLHAHDAATDPSQPSSDRLWWNWARLPAGRTPAGRGPRTVAVSAFTAATLLPGWLGRAVTARPGPTGAREALRSALAGPPGSARRR